MIVNITFIPCPVISQKGEWKVYSGLLLFQKWTGINTPQLCPREAFTAVPLIDCRSFKICRQLRKKNLLFLDATIWRPQTSVFFLDWNVTYHVTFPYRNVYLKGKTKLSSTASTWSDISIWEKTREREIVDLSTALLTHPDQIMYNYLYFTSLYFHTLVV